MLEKTVLAHSNAGPGVEHPLLFDLRGVKKDFTIRHALFTGHQHHVRAVDGIDLQLYRGETLGLVGESGSGKSTLGRLMSRLEKPSEGCLFFEGKDIAGFSGEAMKSFRRSVQLVFQDPYASLNPRKSAGSIIGEPLMIHGIGGKRKDREETVARLMEVVGLRREQMGRYPHEFSGGQRQRIGIARALALKPRLIIADEPVSALDVSIQAQILNLLKDLRREYELTYLFITHDLDVVGYMSDRVAVMYLGRIVELASGDSLCRQTLHPYTEALFSALPASRPEDKKKRRVLEGESPSPLNPPAGCAFHTRCPRRMERCLTERPELKTVQTGHQVACHLYDPET